MKNQIIVFAVAVGVLIIAVSVWVVTESKRLEPASDSAVELSDSVAISEETVIETVDSESGVESISDDFDGDTTSENAEATTVSRKRSQQQPNYPKRMASGFQAFFAGDYERAVIEFAAAAVLESTAVDPLLRLAETQFYLGQYEKSRTNLDAVEKLDATHPDIFILRGRILIKEEQPSEAEKAFAKTGTAGVYYRGILAAFYDRADEAKGLLQSALAGADESLVEKANQILEAYNEYALFPDSTKFHIDTLLARAFNQVGEYELAIVKLKPVLQNDPGYRDAWLLLGYAYFAQEKYELARQTWQTAYSLDTAKAETQYFLGLAHEKLGDYPKAEEYLLLAKENRFERVAELNQKLADVYYVQNKYKESADLYAEIIQMDANVNITEFVRPVYLYLERVGDGRAAWEMAKLALQRYPESARAYNLAGWASMGNGYLPEARAYLEKSLQLDPSLSGSHYNLGRYFEAVSDLDLARKYYKQAFELGSGSAIGVQAAEAYNRLIE